MTEQRLWPEQMKPPATPLVEPGSAAFDERSATWTGHMKIVI